MRFALLFVVCVYSFVCCADDSVRWAGSAPKPDWIWDANGSSNGQRIYLRKSFEIDAVPKTAKLYTTCDNQMTLSINGKRIGASSVWPQPIHQDVAKHLKVGNNIIAVEAANEGGVAAFVFKMTIGSSIVIRSDTSWDMSRDKPIDGWLTVDEPRWTGTLKKLGQLGVKPWGLPGEAKRGGSITQTEDIQTLDGFKVELVHRVPKESQGSWVSLANGPDGRLVASDQGGVGAFWIRVSESADGPTAKVTPIQVFEPESNRLLSGAQGLLWAFDSLWFHRNGGNLFRASDSDGDGQLDRSERIPSQRAVENMAITR